MIPRYTEELGTVVPDADGKYVTYEDHNKSEAKAENAAAKRAYLKFWPIVDDLRRKLDAERASHLATLERFVPRAPITSMDREWGEMEIRLQRGKIESTEPGEVPDLGEPDEIPPGAVELLRQLAENVVDTPIDLLPDEDDEQSLGELYRQVKRLRGEMFALQSWAFAQDPAHGHMTLQADRETDDDGK